MKVTLCERGKEQVDGKGAIQAEASNPPILHTWRSTFASLGHVREEELFFFSCERSSFGALINFFLSARNLRELLCFSHLVLSPLFSLLCSLCFVLCCSFERWVCVLWQECSS